MIDEMLIDISPGERRVALLEAGRLSDLFVFRPGRESLVGTVHLGRVTRVLPGLDAAFVDIGLPEAAFLRLADTRAPDRSGGPDGAPPSRIAGAVHEGEAVMVQVVRDALGGKGPRVTADVTLPGRLLVYTPNHPGISVSRRIADAGEERRLHEIMGTIARPGEGFILRTAAVGAETGPLSAEAVAHRDLWARITAARAGAEPPARLFGELDPVLRTIRDHAEPTLRRIRVDDRRAVSEIRQYCERVFPDLTSRLELHEEGTPLFESRGVEDQIEGALSPRVDLASGAAIYIDEMEALTAVDVDTGRRVGRSSAAGTVLETNLEAAAEIARQIRLRDIGGLIVVDFVRMDRAHDARRVLETLRAACAADRVPVRVVGMTRAGLTEVTRRRMRESLARTLTEACGPCRGSGRVRSAETVALAALRSAAREARARPQAALAVVAAPRVVDALEGPVRPAVAELESETGRRLTLRAEPGFPEDGFEVLPETGSGER